jgi:uncharacterized cofD-like protein
MKKKKIVTVGGGTGSFTLLSGLKKYPVEISAIVSMADDGGSTGVLRDELGVLPPGDVRQCLVALSESSEKMRELMGYRFENGGLKGHNFGNIFVSALEKICGGMSDGLEEAAEILKVRGRVLPVTEDDMRLVVELENGRVLHGEDQLDGNEELRKQGVALKRVSLRRNVRANPKAVRALREADVVILGPGDQFGSLVPNLLVKDIARTIKASKAHVVYVANLTNKRGLTSGWTVQEYVRSLEKYIGKGRIDSVIWNTRRIPKALLEKYEEHEGEDALVRTGDEERKTYRLFKADVADVREVSGRKGDAIAATRSFIRHNPDRLAQAILFLIDIESNRKLIKEIL